MTKEDIKKALELCTNDEDCEKCPYCDTGCTRKLRKDSFALIIEQDVKIERLKEEVKQAQIDVLNELKKKTHNYYPSIDSYCISQHVVLVRDIDELIKEVENDK